MNRDELLHQIRQRIKDRMPHEDIQAEAFALFPGLTLDQFLEAYSHIAREYVTTLGHKGTRH